MVITRRERTEKSHKAQIILLETILLKSNKKNHWGTEDIKLPKYIGISFVVFIVSLTVSLGKTKDPRLIDNNAESPGFKEAK